MILFINWYCVSKTSKDVSLEIDNLDLKIVISLSNGHRGLCGARLWCV